MIQSLPSAVGNIIENSSINASYSGKLGAGIPISEFADGNSKEFYANNSSCKWLITAPLGKRIHIEFLSFDTQAKVDFVYLFDGNSSIPENIIAKFSGSKKPPTVTSRTNQVLVWFVTDKSVPTSGWKLKYSFID